MTSLKQPAMAHPVIGRRGFIAGLSGMLLGAASCDRSKKSVPSRDMPHVVFVVLDTVRADHTSLHGYRRPTTPYLDRLADHAVRFDHAMAPAPWTLPSHAAMFTGQYPFMTGVHTRLVEGAEGRTIFEPPLDDAFITLAEALRDEGYATGAFTANSVYMTERYNLSQGFEEYVINRAPAVELLPEALRWFESNRHRPSFLYLNFMDAHYPINITERPGVVEGEVPQDPELLKYLYDALQADDYEVEHGLVEGLIRQYDVGIANADLGVGQLVAHLEERGLMENTLVIVTSDHGEFLGEFRYVGHSKDVYQPVIGVPLLIRPPHQEQPERVTRAVSLNDLAGIVLEHVLGSEAEKAWPSFWKGNSTRTPVIAENYYSRSWDVFHETGGHRYWRVRAALYDWPWKFIQSSDGAHELYHLEGDPAEQDNRLAAEPVRGAEMLARLEAFRPVVVKRDAPEVPDLPSLTEEEIREMETLGYL